MPSDSSPPDARPQEPTRGPKGRLGRLRLGLEVLGMRALYRLVPLLPHESLVALGRGLGRWGYRLARSERRVALANLDLAYGDTLSARAKRRIARKSFENFGQVGLEIFWGRRMTPRQLARLVDFDESQARFVVEGSRTKKTGIALVSHMGSWEILNLHGSAKVPFTTLARRLRNEPLNDLVTANRSALGTQIVFHDDAARGLLRAIKQHRWVGIPLDQNTRPDRGGVYVTFFGKPVAASRAIALFALRTGCPIVPAVSIPIRGGRYRIEWADPIPHPTEGDRDARERALTQACVTVIEGWVRAHPEAWLWMYRRWKYRPTQDPTGFPYYSKFIPEPSRAPHEVSA